MYTLKLLISWITHGEYKCYIHYILNELDILTVLPEKDWKDSEKLCHFIIDKVSKEDKAKLDRDTHNCDVETVLNNHT